jgi:cysteine desulfurase
MGDIVYFDNAATSPLDLRVAEAMRPWIGETFGNPSSLHGFGRRARQAVDRAREQLAALLNAHPGEIVFTGSGTEADNLALIGVATAYDPGDCHIVTSSIEHPAVLETCRYLGRRGVEVSYLPVDGDGIVDPASLESGRQPGWSRSWRRTTSSAPSNRSRSWRGSRTSMALSSIPTPYRL